MSFAFYFIMYNPILLINNISFLLIRNTLIEMTVNNPIFIFTVITVIWFIPGIIVRRYKEINQIKKNKKIQSDSIEKLYPKAKDEME